MKEATDYSETSVQLYQTVRRLNVEQNMTKTFLKKFIPFQVRNVLESGIA